MQHQITQTSEQEHQREAGELVIPELPMCILFDHQNKAVEFQYGKELFLFWEVSTLKNDYFSIRCLPIDSETSKCKKNCFNDSYTDVPF